MQGRLMMAAAVLGACGTEIASGQNNPPAKPQPMPMAMPPADLVITEVLFRVPRGKEGDAGGDGQRQANGDEFVELVNTGERPVQLAGYTLLDSNCYGRLTDKGKREFKQADVKADGKDVAFIFPELELKPGEIVVVFNGFEQKLAGPVGDSKHAPTKNEKFKGAFVFSMGIDNKYGGFGDRGDWVLLLSPQGEALESVSWGQPDVPPPKANTRSEAPAEPKGSVTRTARTGRFKDHADTAGGGLFSPGVFVHEGVESGTGVSGGGSKK